MSKRVSHLLEATSLTGLKEQLAGESGERLRPILIAEYERLFHYQNIAEWNRLVRVCEVLAIIGWGEREPVEALAKKWVNGSFYTTLQTREFRKLSGHGNTGSNTEAEWSKRGSSFVLRGGSDTKDRGIDAFASQRVPLPKNPIRIGQRVANHQKSAGPFVAALSELRERLDRELAAKAYGDGFECVTVACAFSNHDDDHETVRAEYFHDQKDVPKGFEGKYYVRPRLRFGKLTAKDGRLHWHVDRHFTRAEGELARRAQKRLFTEDLRQIVEDLGKRLAKKKVRYDVSRLRADLDAILETW